jgi:hypothetical protein
MATSRRLGASTSKNKPMITCSLSWAVVMEAAGIEPASENVPQESLHTYPVLFFSCPVLKKPASWPEHQPIKFRLAPPGRQFEAILHKVTPFNRPTGESVKDVASG